MKDRVDVAVVGSGPTGAAYTRTVTEALPSADILLIEAGPVIGEPPGGHIVNIQDAGLRQRALGLAMGAVGPPNPAARPGLAVPELHSSGDEAFAGAAVAWNVGGMGAHWFGACPRPYGGERPPLLPPAELDLALAEAERLLEVEVHGLHNEVSAWIRRRLNGQLGQARPAGRRIQGMPLAARAAEGGVHRSGSDTILRPVLDGSAHVELRPGTLCRRVLMDGDRAAGVELVDLASQAVTVMRARHVVVACDGLRTPQLLFASGVRPAALGTHLNEHMQFAATMRLDDAPHDRPYVRQPGDFTMLTDHGHLVALSEPGVTWIPYVDGVFPFSGQIAVIDPDSLANPAGDAPAAAIHLFAAKDVRAADRLAFSPTDKDRLGMPAMQVCYAFTPRDLTTQHHARKALLEVLRALGTPIGSEPTAPLPVGSSLHYQGTVRMGATAADSVCDRSSLVWGTKNLRVAGNGVIAASTACNPTLTSVAYATIGARAIAADLAG